MFWNMYVGLQMDVAELEELGRQFADAIPEEQLSPAKVQEFLIAQKTNPRQAVQCVNARVDEQPNKELPEAAPVSINIATTLE
jgi:hypothetical protein